MILGDKENIWGFQYASNSKMNLISLAEHNVF